MATNYVGGILLAVVEITSNDLDESVVEVELSGTGVEAATPLCPAPVASLDYDGSTIPDVSPAGAWYVNRADAGVTWNTDGSNLYINGYDAIGAVEFGRLEASLEVAERYAIEVRMHVTRFQTTLHFLTEFAFGASDTQKDIAVWGSALTGKITILTQTSNSYVASGVDLSSPAAYRLEVDRSQADPADQTAKLYRDDILLITVPYMEITDVPSGRISNFFGFAGHGTDTAWDYVRYEVCATPEAQIEGLIADIEDILIDPTTPQEVLANLTKAHESLQEALVQLAADEIPAAYTELIKATKKMLTLINKGTFSTTHSNMESTTVNLQQDAFASSENTATDFENNVTAVINKIVGVAKQMALAAIADALNFAGDSAVDKEIAKAEQNMAKAQEELDFGNPDKAIKHFRKAWEHAQKAIKKGGGILAKGQTEFTEKHDLDSSLKIPQEFLLEQNYPNPFNPETEIRFQLPKASHVVLRIFNTLGQQTRTLVDRPYPAGYHSVHWDSEDSDGKAVASGIYLYQLQAGDFVHARKMSLVR